LVSRLTLPRRPGLGQLIYARSCWDSSPLGISRS
jgi:hypothetical protein